MPKIIVYLTELSLFQMLIFFFIFDLEGVLSLPLILSLSLILSIKRIVMFIIGMLTL